MFLDLVRLVPGFVLVLDGLDEYSVEYRLEIIKLAIDMTRRTKTQSWSVTDKNERAQLEKTWIDGLFLDDNQKPSTRDLATTNLRYQYRTRVFLSSRDEGDIIKYLEARGDRVASIKIGLNNSKDIALCVTSSIPSIEQSFGGIGGVLRCKLERASLMMWHLQHQTTLNELEAAIEELPEGLQAAYDTIMRRMKNLSIAERSQAIRSLAFICCSGKALTSGELCLALSIRPGQLRVSDNDRFRRNLIDLLGPLVEVKSHGIVPIHKSMVDYFFMNHISALEAHLDLATVCMTYLSLEFFDFPASNESVVAFTDSGFFGLLYYVRSCLMFHIQCVVTESMGKSSAKAELNQAYRDLEAAIERTVGSFLQTLATRAKHLFEDTGILRDSRIIRKRNLTTGQWEDCASIGREQEISPAQAQDLISVLEMRAEVLHLATSEVLSKFQMQGNQLINPMPSEYVSQADRLNAEILPPHPAVSVPRYVLMFEILRHFEHEFNEFWLLAREHLELIMPQISEIIDGILPNQIVPLRGSDALAILLIFKMSCSFELLGGRAEEALEHLQGEIERFGTVTWHVCGSSLRNLLGVLLQVLPSTIAIATPHPFKG
ncbi:MAG: hypothetical protein M1839_008349 [Geoglossum umbratile]|nr:MAG: hypothetical protein M1839_008349 [Geoglossum umbratile]